MQRIDLGDDRLGPERVRKRQQQSGDGAGQRRVRQPAAEVGEQTDGDGRPDRREQVQAARRDCPR